MKHHNGIAILLGEPPSVPCSVVLVQKEPIGRTRVAWCSLRNGEKHGLRLRPDPAIGFSLCPGSGPPSQERVAELTILSNRPNETLERHRHRRLGVLD